MHDTLRELVTRLDHGKSAVFARRVGLSKTTLHYWLREGGIPRLTAHLHVISQTGLALPNLLTGDLSGWPPDTVEIHQLALLFSDRARRTVSRSHDWDRIRHELSEMSRGLTVLSASVY